MRVSIHFNLLNDFPTEKMLNVLSQEAQSAWENRKKTEDRVRLLQEISSINPETKQFQYVDVYQHHIDKNCLIIKMIK